MRIFLAWHSKGAKVQSRALADAMVSYYQELFVVELNSYVYCDGRNGLIYLTEMPLAENTQFFQRGKDYVYFSTGAPSGLNRVYKNIGRINEESQLGVLRELFESKGHDLIKKISPPFIFGFVRNNSLKIIHDGLGFEQGFLFENDDYWVCSNKLWPIINFVGGKFSVNDHAWRHYLDIGWFPIDSTPFGSIFALGKGSVYQCSNGKVTSVEIDCLQDWTKPFKKEKVDILEYAKVSFSECLEELIERYSKEHVVSHLSGGRDTRMILSFLLNRGFKCYFTTAGEMNSADVKVVQQIEKEYNCKVEYSNASMVGLDESTFCGKIRKFIKWQDGLGEVKNSKYLNIEPYEGDFSPELSGLIGGYYRGFGYPSGPLDQLRKGIKTALKMILGRKVNKIPPSKEVQEIRQCLFQEGKQYGLKGKFLYDYYGFTGKARKWASACAATTYNGYLLPFLDIGLIRTCFSLSEKDKVAHTLHTYITESMSKGLTGIPYDTDLVLIDKTVSMQPFDENLLWTREPAVSIMERVLSQEHYLWENLLNKNEITVLWNDHCTQNARHGSFFWRIIGFYFWFEHFKEYLK